MMLLRSVLGANGRWRWVDHVQLVGHSQRLVVGMGIVGHGRGVGQVRGVGAVVRVAVVGRVLGVGHGVVAPPVRPAFPHQPHHRDHYDNHHHYSDYGYDDKCDCHGNRHLVASRTLSGFREYCSSSTWKKIYQNSSKTMYISRAKV